MRYEIFDNDSTTLKYELLHKCKQSMKIVFENVQGNRERVKVRFVSMGEREREKKEHFLKFYVFIYSEKQRQKLIQSCICIAIIPKKKEKIYGYHYKKGRKESVNNITACVFGKEQGIIKKKKGKSHLARSWNAGPTFFEHLDKKNTKTLVCNRKTL